MCDIIDSSLLCDDDKTMLKYLITNKIFPNGIDKLSIFSNSGRLTKTDKYEFYTYDKNECYYLLNINLWMDNEFKIIPYSNWWYSTDLERFMHHINAYLTYIPTININHIGIEVCSGNYVAITKWFDTYGHVLDELCCLRECMVENNLTEMAMPFISIPFAKYIYNNSNYKDICDTIFDRRYLNVSGNTNLIKINNLTLIKHIYGSKTFHSFPLSVTTSIENKLGAINKKAPTNNKVIFITRGDNDPPHLPRNLKNKKQIERYLRNNNVDIFNPESRPFSELVHTIKLYNNIIITWGSALTNLIFCNPSSEITILKSKSYELETIDLFNKIINTRKLKIKIIDSIENAIDPTIIYKKPQPVPPPPSNLHAHIYKNFTYL